MLLVEVGQLILGESVPDRPEHALPRIGRELDAARGVEALERREKPHPAELMGVLHVRDAEVARGLPCSPDHGAHEGVPAELGDVTLPEGAGRRSGVERVPGPTANGGRA